jgi:hypothetical protein
MREKNKLSGFFMLIIFAALLLAASQAGAMRFSHVVHDKNEVSQCARCHTPGAVSIVPARAVCYECHEEKEIQETVLGPTKTHTPLWVRQHGIDSQSAGAQCSDCHSISFCVDCHKGGELGVDLQKRAVRLDTAPSTHTSRFRIVHPLKATAEQIEKCYTCHSKSDCVDCHESYRNKFPGRKIVSHQMNWEQLIDHAIFPSNQCQDCHPDGALSSSDWSRGHAPEARRSLSSCQSCHPDGDACLDCHSATTGLMISPHPANWGKIQTKFRRESPEVCAKCH